MNQMLKYPFNDIEKIPVIINNNNNNSHDWLWSRAAKIYSMRVRKSAYLTSETKDWFSLVHKHIYKAG